MGQAASKAPIPTKTLPKVSEKGIDPEFASRLAKLGQVPVSNHPPNLRQKESIIQSMNARRQSELEATSSIPTPNKLSAEALVNVLERRRVIPEDNLQEAVYKRLSLHFNAPTSGPMVKNRHVTQDNEHLELIKATWAK